VTLPGGTTEHRAGAETLPPLRCAIVTVSDSRTEATDESGALMRSLLAGDGHTVAHYRLLPNDEAAVTAHLRELLAMELDAILLTGGTGLGRRDRTVEAVRAVLQKELPGFGELFRMLSYQEQIGTAAIMSRALAGAAQDTLVVSLPGSRAAVELALTRMLLPEMRHIIWELRR
jgi:molybdenum cofactor biosynthesis protein B